MIYSYFTIAKSGRVNLLTNRYSSGRVSSLGFEQTHQKIDSSIKAYNELRPHGSCDYLTPCQAHLQGNVLEKRWKKYPAKWQKEKPLVVPV